MRQISFKKIQMLPVVLSLIIGVSQTAQAQMLDPEARNLLINKFEKVMIGLAPTDAAYTSVTLRLADLLSERARFDAMKELESGCVQCNAGIKDRKNALKLYESALAKVPAESQGKIIFQIGHLNEMLGQTSKAESVYLNIIKENKSETLAAESRAALGELYFKQRKFSNAREQFEAARKGDLGQQGLASYRIAWCHFNEGNVAAAAKEAKIILSSPKLLTRTATSGVVSVDKQFQDEVSRDYATFLARLKPESKDVEELYSLSPENTRLGHVEFLATELERLGEKERSIAVWNFAQERQTQPKNRLEGSVRLAQLNMEMNKTEQASKEFEKALTLWGQVNCDQSCTELKSRLRKFVTDWNRVSKKQLSAEILNAYESYLAVFTDDAEMRYWAAEVARELKNYSKSLELYQGYVLTSLEKAKSAQGKDKSDLLTNVENALLKQIEVAEVAQDKTQQLSVYDRYLQYSPTKAKKVEVQYQKAYLTYKQENYSDAALQLREVALLNDKDSESIRIQAADLALDALAILKDDSKIEQWANEFANKFPKKRTEFLSVARKSVFNQSAQTVTSGGDLNSAWVVLNRADITGADEADKIVYLKNKIILAEKLNKFSDARNAVDLLLAIKTLKPEDQEFALAKKAWFSELALDFQTAYSMNQKMKLSELKPDEKVLRLAMFAELADQNAKKHYEDYLVTTQNKDNAKLVAVRLVRESKQPLADLNKLSKYLKDDPALLAQLNLEIYAKTRDQKLLKETLASKALLQTPAGKELFRESLIQQVTPIDKELAAQVIGTKTQREISTGIKKRVATIEKLEAIAAKAVESADWMAQVIALGVLGREVERFYNELIALPIPSGLSPEEESQYLQLLSQQASPYQVKASDIKAKLNEFWATGGIKKVTDDFAKLEDDLRKLYSSQLLAIQSVAPDSEKAGISAALSQSVAARAMPTLSEIESARKSVRENPQDKNGLIKLSELEKKMGRTTLSTYFEARAQKLEESKNE